MRKTKPSVGECPSAEAILSALEHPGRSTPESERVFGHLLSCRECRAALAFVGEAVAEQLDRKRADAAWMRFRVLLTKKIMQDAARQIRVDEDEEIDAIAAAGPAVLAMQSGYSGNQEHAWRADLTFPDVDQAEMPLTLSVYDHKGIRIKSGTFMIFGIDVPIKGGTGQLARSQLLENYHKGGAAFKWTDGSIVRGAPILNA